MDEVTLGRILTPLGEENFPKYMDLHEAVRRVFSEHADEFPAGYSYMQLIDWAEKKRWITEDPGGGYRFQYKE